ncbi:hypothetical protein K9L05_02010 [Candidatus Babeliales bacterium]|nr:hypothetical protein [Candidatus Babeliales bacterium]MCF7899403.1 hypothetical protein [Candidatus Babeliales bacterium]
MEILLKNLVRIFYLIIFLNLTNINAMEDAQELAEQNQEILSQENEENKIWGDFLKNNPEVLNIILEIQNNPDERLFEYTKRNILNFIEIAKQSGKLFKIIILPEESNLPPFKRLRFGTA